MTTTLKLKNRKLRVAQNGLFDFLKTKTTVYRKKSKRGHYRGGSGPESRYKGARITTLFGGQYTTSIDPESRFDSLRDAKRFIDYWKRRNPGGGFGKRIARITGPDKDGKWSVEIVSVRQGTEYFVSATLHSSKAAAQDYAKQKHSTVVNPAKFDRCVKKVAKSLRKAGKTGSPYAICTASGARNQPVTDLVPGSSLVVDTLARTGSAWAKVGSRIGKGVKGIAAKVTKRKRNPQELAERRYEEFHGEPSKRTLHVTEHEHHHSKVVGLGKLICLNVVATNGQELPPIIGPGFHYSASLRELWLTHKGQTSGEWGIDTRVPASQVVWLTSSEDNKQLILKGGDQSLDTKALGFQARDVHDSMLIGTIHRIWYLTRKSFEGPDLHAFYHDFGSEGSRGELPILIYHPRNPSLEIAGGRYKIAEPDKSIGNVSPGIIG